MSTITTKLKHAKKCEQNSKLVKENMDVMIISLAKQSAKWRSCLVLYDEY